MVKAACLALALTAGPVQAECRLALVLALDVSASVDAAEHELQRTGLMGALDDADIRRAILSGGDGHVAIAIYEWSGRRQSVVVQDWTHLHDDADIDRVISAIGAHPRSHVQFPTALGYALGFGAGLLRSGPECRRRVIDVSGDGVNNDGFPPENAYRHFPFEGVTVNGLAVLGADPEVEDYYRDEVRHGPGAFVETSRGYPGYRRAMTRKLFRELNDMVIGMNGIGPHQ